MAADTVRRYVWELTPVAPPAPNAPVGSAGSPPVAGRTVAVIGGSEGAAENVAAVLAERGARLWRLGDPGVPDAVVDLTLAAPFDPADTSAWEKPLLRTLAVLRHCYDDWAAEIDARRIGYLVVTYLGGHAGYGRPGVSRTPVHQPLGGIWAGLAKTVHREVPNANIRVVDVADPDSAELPRIVADELYQWGPCEIAYVDGRRHTLVPRPRAVAAPSTEPGPDAVVLVCGGGTGTGFALAAEFARRHGCEVVVTGRRPVPDGTEEWLHLDEPSFDAYRRELMRGAAADGTLKEARTRVGRMRQNRELNGNLHRAAAEGLRIRYAACDLSDADAVAAMVAELGPRLSGVVYNAGVDRPARLPAKSDPDFLAGVAVKVVGFLHVFAAVRDRDLAFFCNAGSLTGRLGGMVGELDYAAGNEALARLALWADRSSPFRVLSTCWPLWKDLSVSTNMDAALRYMAAMDPADGVGRWCDELVAPGPGEVTFLGPLGPALQPVQARHYLVEHMLPGFETAYPRIFHLGEPLAYRRPTLLRARMRIGTDTAPVLADFRVNGAPALPVGLLLDNALRSAEWTVPEHGPDLTPTELIDIGIEFAGLRSVAGTVVLEREIVGGESDGAWAAEVVYRRLDTASREPFAWMTVRYAPLPPAPLVPAAEPSEVAFGGGSPADVSGPRWRGVVLPVARWSRHASGILTAPIPRCPPADLWSAEPAPEHRVPVAAVDNILRAAAAERPGARRVGIGRLAVYPGAAEADLAIGAPPGDVWYAARRGDAHAVLALHRIELGT